MPMIKVLCMRRGDGQPPPVYEVYLNTDRVIAMTPSAGPGQWTVTLDSPTTLYTELEDGAVRRIVEAHNQGGLRHREKLLTVIETLVDVHGVMAGLGASKLIQAVMEDKIQVTREKLTRLGEEWYRQPDTPGVDNRS